MIAGISIAIFYNYAREMIRLKEEEVELKRKENEPVINNFELDKVDAKKELKEKRLE